ncbi:hypothetical protein SS50377_20564 [Spironucleus salmonicida]|uniref:Uncharacterized protein n=1 Tax=Spironucleus salmonicida TaxID=348837 RepID=V6LVC7_9EUKA|nr:hypothetical protein SS50377_20564 [Spironucleus salmonicida]|eukprot:EST48178.1 Hypothetical protein SS50377_11696 [Spironucleus salmonicida]
MQWVFSARQFFQITTNSQDNLTTWVARAIVKCHIRVNASILGLAGSACQQSFNFFKKALMQVGIVFRLKQTLQRWRLVEGSRLSRYVVCVEYLVHLMGEQRLYKLYISNANNLISDGYSKCNILNQSYYNSYIMNLQCSPKTQFLQLQYI